jgi:hypothetical protein
LLGDGRLSLEMPSIRSVLTLLLATVSLAGCGDSSTGAPEIIVNGDDCSYEGSTELTAGTATVVLQLRNLGHSAVSVVRLEDGRPYGDLVEHYDTAPEPTPDPPPWATEIVRFELEQEGGEADGASRETTLTEGSYGVICIDYWGFAADGRSAGPVAEVTVSAAGTP